jgi:NAD(P)H-dependent flavin oxidoreductase YrpB (nitropropane dioxygenase family)
VVDAVDIPVIAAGGFFDGRGLVAALAYGAAGIAMGTRFLLTSESPVSLAVKQRYLAAGLTGTVVTDALDGVPHRVLRTSFVDGLTRGGLVRAARNAGAFRRLSGRTWTDLAREGLAMRRSGELSMNQVMMAANTPILLRTAMVEGDPEHGVMASGQVAGLIDDLPTCADLVNRIMAEAAMVLDRLSRVAS